MAVKKAVVAMAVERAVVAIVQRYLVQWQGGVDGQRL
jgi:hypothetical protein